MMASECDTAKERVAFRLRANVFEVRDSRSISGSSSKFPFRAWFVFNSLDGNCSQAIDYKLVMAIHVSRKGLCLCILAHTPQGRTSPNVEFIWLKFLGIMSLAGIFRQNLALE